MALRPNHIKGAGAAKSPLEEALALQLRVARIPFTRQVRFHPVRKWVFDFVILGTKVAIEVEGGLWVKGRHNRPQGYESDCEKYSEAAILGWAVIRVTKNMINDGRAMDLVARALRKKS